jgi:hypothetical protein
MCLMPTYMATVDFSDPLAFAHSRSILKSTCNMTEPTEYILSLIQ